jgi:hypothetical protein
MIFDASDSCDDVWFGILLKKKKKKKKKKKMYR